MRLGISVPNDLIKRLEPMKPFINISKLCRDAILENVMLYERAKHRAENNGMGNVAIKLFERGKPIVVDWELLGMQDAKLWASLASNDDWDKLFEILDYFESEGKSPFEARYPIPRVKGAKTYYDRQHENDGDTGWFAQRINDTSNPYMVAQLEYQRGFFMYMIIIRQKIRKLFKAELKAQKEANSKLKGDIKAHVDVPKALK